MPETIKDIEKDVSNLKTNMAQINLLVARLDDTLQKITNVSAEVSKVLAVQDTRLAQQEVMCSNVAALLEKRRVETNDDVENLHQRINSAQKGFKEEMEKMNSQILQEMKEMREEHRKSLDSLNRKVSQLEKMIWMASGGAVIIGFLVSKVVNIGSFFT